MALACAVAATAVLSILAWFLATDPVRIPEADDRASAIDRGAAARIESGSPGQTSPAGGGVAQVAGQPAATNQPKKIMAPPKPERLPNVDRRPQQSASAMEASHHAAISALERQIPGVTIQFDPITGAPSHIAAPGRFLAPGKPGVLDIHEPVRDFVDRNSELFGHDASALAAGSARITREDVTAHNGMRTVVWQQELDGIPLFQTVFKANLTKNGDVINLGSHFMKDPAAASGKTATQRAALIIQPAVSPAAALSKAAANVGDTVSADQVVASGPVVGVEKNQNLAAPGLSDTQANLTWVPMSGKELRLGWEVVLMSTRIGEMFRIVVDAESGETLIRQSLTNYISNASYRVFARTANRQPYDSPTPFSPGHDSPSSAQPAAVNRELVTIDALNTTASPNGWIDDGGTQTLGNNVDAHTDTDANNSPDLPRPSSATRNFDFTMDLATQAPSAYKEAAVANLFYLCNWIHDRFYELGFTETAGNFQTDNFGRGGIGNDAVQADAQDGSGTNNANFSTPPDGSAGRMQMYVFTGPAPDIDGDLDAEIVIHEYTHGLSNRLVGGGVGMSANQSQGMGEGWSDFYALCLLSEPGDGLDGCYAAGGYATRNFSGLQENYYFGIRRYPYSTDMSRNPLTFKDIDPAQASSHSGIPRSSIIGNTANEVHNEGEVWCVTLWDMRANLITKHGYSTANELTLQIVTDAMKLCPANPNFIQSRDAIIQADLVNNAGANRNEIWAAFAKRGMGASASSPASSTTSGVVEAFDLPDDLSVSPSAEAVFAGEAGGPFNPTSVTYTLSNNGVVDLDWAASVGQPWLALSSASGTIAGGGSATVTATLNAAANSLPNGLHTAAIAFTNLETGMAFARTAKLRIGQADYFTELFDSSAPHDIDNQSFTFTPDSSASGYAMIREPAASFPTSTTGATSLTMSDDTSAQVTLTGGAQVKLFGVTYSSFFVGSNGYVTFGTGDDTWEESAAAHFDRPRISALFDDLFPTGNKVTWKQVADRVAVTWSNVREYGTSNSNSLQIEMFFDGRIRITHLAVAATDGLIGLSAGGGTPADFVESDFSSYPSVSLAVNLPAAATEGDGVLQGQGTVTRSSASSSSLTVTLTSNDPTELTVPASVTIPASQTGATFDLTLVDDSLLDGTQSATVTASASGATNGSASIAIHDNESTTLAVTLPASVTEGDSGVTGTVSVNVAPDAPVAVTLSSSDVGNLTLPETVVIPAGEVSAEFPINVIDDDLIDGARMVDVVAHVAGWTNGQDSVAVQDNEASTLAVSLPAMLEGETGKLGGVTVSGILVADLEIALSSNDASELTVPSTVLIPSGQSSATFALTIVDDADVDGPQTVEVLATAPGFSSGAGAGIVADDETPAVPANPQPPHLKTDTHPDTDLAWAYASGTGGVPVDYDVYFGSNPNPGAAEFRGTTATPDWKLPQLAQGATYYWQIIARKGAVSTAGPVWEFAVPIGGPPVRFEWSLIASPQLVDVPFPVTITGYDSLDIVSTSFSGPLTIAPVTSSPIVISEVNPNTPDAVEFTNVSSAAVDVSGWQIHLYHLDGWPAPAAVFSIPEGSVCPAGGTFTLEEFGTSPGVFPALYFGGNINWTSSAASPIGVLLQRPDGTIADFVAAAAADPAAITSPVGIPSTEWSGAVVVAPVDGGHGYQRAGHLDAGVAGDWTTASPGIGILNPGMNLPFPVSNAAVDPESVAMTSGTWTGTIRIRDVAPAIMLQARDAEGHHGETEVLAVTALGSLSIAANIPFLTEGDDTVPAALTVTVDPVPTDDLTVDLTSSRTADVASTSVVIPAGEGIVNVPLTVSNNLLLDGSRSLTLSASAPGRAPASVSVMVHDNESTAITLTLPGSLAEGQGTATGQIFVATPPATDVSVALSSSDATEVTVPQQVVIPTGQTSASFSMGVIDDDLIDGSQPVSLVAHVHGWEDGTAATAVQDNEPTHLSISLAAAVSEGSGPQSGTVSLPGRVVQPLEVSLASSSADDLVVPATVTVDAGASSATFSWAAVDDPIPESSETVTVTATVTGFVDGIASALIADNDLASLVVGAVDAVCMRNSPFMLTLTALDADGNALADFTGPVELSAAGDAGPVAMTPTDATPFAGGTWSGDVTMLDFGTGVRITAASGPVTASSSSFMITHGPMDRFVFDPIGAVQYAGVPFPVTVRARDAFGNDVLSYADSASLATDTGGSVSEVSIGSGTSLANVPLGTGSHDCRAQVIHTPAELGGADFLNSLAIHVGSLPGQAMTNWTIRLKHTSRQDFSADPSWDSTGWTTVYQSDETISSTGWVWFPFSTTFAYNGTDNLMIDFSFNNSSNSYNGTVRYTSVAAQRTIYATANSTEGDPLGWSDAFPAATVSFSIFNVKISKGLPPVPVNPMVAGPFVNGTWTGDVVIDAVRPSLALLVDDGAFHTGASNAFEMLAAPLALNPEPPFTGGTSNIVSWTPMGSGIELEVERSSDEDFSAPVSSGWLPSGSASHEFTGLPDGSLFWYRARMSRPGSWVSSWSPVISSTQDASPPEVLTDPSPIFTTRSSFAVQGTATDLSGTAFVRIDGTDVATSDAFAHWSKSLPGLVPGANNLTITVGDLAVPSNTATVPCLVYLIAEPTGDGDTDGVENLLEHAFNLDSSAPDAAGRPFAMTQTDATDGRRYLTLQYRRRIQPAGFRYVVQTSPDLVNWTNAGVDEIEETGAAASGDGVTEWVAVRVLPDIGSAGFKFVRLRVELD